MSIAISRTRCSVALALVLGLALPATSSAWAAAANDGVEAGTVRVSGNATISAPADMVTLQIAVVTEYLSSQEAVSTNRRRSNAALTALRTALGDEAELETLGFSLNPQYDYNNKSAGNTRTLRGYLARNVLQVRTSQIERIGEAIDAAATAGSNEIQSLVFGLRDPKPLRMRALGVATRNARQKADAIAKALDVEVGRIRSVEEGQVGVFPERARMQSFASDKATPIEPGGVDVSAQVTLTVELAT